MSYPTKLQCIKRRHGSRQFYLNIPAALAEALECRQGELWRWRIVSRRCLEVRREPEKSASRT